MRIIKDIDRDEYGRRYVHAQCTRCFKVHRIHKHLIIRGVIEDCCRFTKNEKINALQALEDLSDKRKYDSSYDFVMTAIPFIYEMSEYDAKWLRREINNIRELQTAPKKYKQINLIRKLYKIQRPEDIS